MIGFDDSVPYQKTLVLLNLLSSAARDGLGPLASTYLLVSARWSEEHIGSVMFFNLVSTGLCQTFAGDLVDKTTKKRMLCAGACLLVGLMSASIVVLPSFVAVLVTRIIQGVGSAVIPAVISGITLGVVGPTAFDFQVPLNEIGNRAGNGAAALLAGVLAYFVAPSATFFVVLFACAGGAYVVVRQIPDSAINDMTARGEVGEEKTTEPGHDDVISYQKSDTINSKSESDKHKLLEPHHVTGYLQLLQDRRLAVFFFCVFSFHTANASMLPLLGQMMSIGRSESEAIPLAVTTILVGRFTMALVAHALNSRIHTHGRRSLFLVGLASLPIRGVLVAALRTHTVLLLATEVLDGIGDGIYGVMHQVVTRDLTAGSGRFNVALGMVTTCHIFGGATSNLLGEHMASWWGYGTAFVILGLLGLVPLTVFALFFEETRPADIRSTVQVHTPDLNATSHTPAETDDGSTVRRSRIIPAGAGKRLSTGNAHKAQHTSGVFDHVPDRDVTNDL
eukprot:c5252_g2_i1.p1 GENE.c5252_g2_i1~~c5252_g2_i1.p1  ORF type:complete len:506 (-),score=127.74 c5252_g2_i1:109-1626(-)